MSGDGYHSKLIKSSRNVDLRTNEDAGSVADKISKIFNKLLGKTKISNPKIIGMAIGT